jgi:predicted regulator of Ras-like GTPase activity (Roadblock/LC7/MglB family)
VLPILLRRKPLRIEEVFLVSTDGLLINHLSRSLSMEKDADVLGGMLSAIQSFVGNAFVHREHREMHHFNFGDYRILIERGKNVYLAVVYSGTGSAAVRKMVRSVLDRIEAAHGPVLAAWDGDKDKVAGVREVIREHLLKTNERRRWRLPGLS